MSVQPHVYKLTTKEKHLDNFSHVNHAVYLQLYEEARWQMLTDNGYPLSRVLETRLAPVILDIQVVYKKELKNREEVTIETISLESTNRLVINVEQTMYNEKKEIASTLKMRMGIMNLDSRKLLTPNDDWKKALSLESA